LKNIRCVIEIGKRRERLKLDTSGKEKLEDHFKNKNIMEIKYILGPK